MKKLTLSADPEVIEQAKQLAAETGTSVSSLFARIVRLLARKHAINGRIGPIARKASGLVTLTQGKSDRDLLEESLAEKYGIPR